MNFSIGTKLSIWLSLLGIFFISLTGYHAYTQSQSLLLKASEEKLITSNRILAERFSSALKIVSKKVLFLSSLNALKQSNNDLKNHEQAMLIDIFSKMMSNHPELNQIRYISSVNYRNKDLKQYGKEMLRVDRGLHDIEVVKQNLQDKLNYPYVFETLKMPQGYLYFSDISYNRETGARIAKQRPTIRIASPVSSETGENIGLVVINVDLNRLFFLLSYELPEPLIAILTNAQGDYLIYPDPEKVFGFEQGRRHLIQNDVSGIDRFYNGNKAELILNNIVSSQTDESYVGAFLKIPYGKQGTDSFIVLGLMSPSNINLAGSKILGRDIVNLIILFSLLSIIVSLLLSRIISRPVNNMALSIRHYTAGSVLNDLPVSRNDEIGFLARNFSELTLQINQQIHSLEKNRAILEKHEKQLCEAQQIARMGSWEWNAMSNKFSTSKMLKELIGRDLQNLKYLYEIIHPDYLLRFKQEFKQAYKYHYPLHITFKIKCVKGSVLHLRMLGEIAHDGDGKPIGMVGSIQDVTQEQEYIAQLQHLRLEAEEANHSKSEFLANMSHELRTPLHAMLSFAQFGQNPKHNSNHEKLVYYFEMIQQSGERLLELLSGLLDISKLEAGKMEIECTRTNIIDVIESCLKEQESRFKEKELNIEFTYSHDECFGEIDAFRIAQVITNLLNNAVKASDIGSSIMINVDCHNDRNTAGQVLCSIRDLGVGIPDDEIESIFDKFVQSSRSSHKAGGTGLGLAICRQIIALHNGQIWAENHSEGGAVFFISLPFAQNVKPVE